MVAVPTAAPKTHFYGTSRKDVLTGTDGADSLWGGSGDTMSGGLGDDTYYVKSSSDVVVELAGGGADKIHTWMSVDLSDHANIENLLVEGEGLYAAGNGGGNVIQGGAGRQEIYGGRGEDILSGGLGRDAFLVIKGEGNDVITDFSVLEDRVRLTAGMSSFDQVRTRLVQEGADTRLDLGGGDSLLFRNVKAGDLRAENFELELDVSRFGKASFAEEFSAPLSIWDKESNPGGVWRPDYGYQGVNGLGSYTHAHHGEKQIYTSPYFRGHNGDFTESPFVMNGDGTMSIWALSLIHI